MHLALWLKKNGYRADQVQTFLPSPMALSTAMYHTGSNPLAGAPRRLGEVETVKGLSSAGCTRPFCAITTPRIGRCCATP